MEEYEDYVIEPFSSPAAIEIGNWSSKNGEKRKATAIDSIQKERMRRGKLSENYSILQSIVPNLLPKATKERIVSQTMEYIRCLEEERRNLEQLKHSKSRLEMEAKSILSTCTKGRSSVNVSTTSGGVAFFGIQVNFRPRVAVEIFSVFEKNGLDILAANVVVDEKLQQLTLTVTAMVDGANRGNESIEKIKLEILSI